MKPDYCLYCNKITNEVFQGIDGHWQCASCIECLQALAGEMIIGPDPILLASGGAISRCYEPHYPAWPIMLWRIIWRIITRKDERR